MIEVLSIVDKHFTRFFQWAMPLWIYFMDVLWFRNNIMFLYKILSNELFYNNFLISVSVLSLYQSLPTSRMYKHLLEKVLSENLFSKTLCTSLSMQVNAIPKIYNPLYPIDNILLFRRGYLGPRIKFPSCTGVILD